MGKEGKKEERMERMKAGGKKRGKRKGGGRERGSKDGHPQFLKRGCAPRTTTDG